MPVRTAYVGTEAVGDVLTKANFDKLPGGWIGYAESTSTQAGVGAEVDVTGCSVTVTVNSTRRIRITGRVGCGSVSAADTGVFVLIKDGSTEVGRGAITISNTAREHTCLAECVLTPAGGSKTYKLTLQAIGGTVATVSLGSAPNFILVEDIGPAS